MFDSQFQQTYTPKVRQIKNKTKGKASYSGETAKAEKKQEKEKLRKAKNRLRKDMKKNTCMKRTHARNDKHLQKMDSLQKDSELSDFSSDYCSSQQDYYHEQYVSQCEYNQEDNTDYYDWLNHYHYYGYDYYEDFYDSYFDDSSYHCRGSYYRDDDYGQRFGQYRDSSYPSWNPTGLNTWQRFYYGGDD